ncbi:putative chromosome transmission fidelity protein [Arabidopsis thaliana]|uniref:Chromosome transmission fidelity-like protein n=1 Tax=Arabidopsis thaliana TaxID=3702 RepID=F4KEU4_ARATH|nr:chromosome transmission fidelity-like protein [Arabidopsis thaliana]AED96186.1 chromosome transmission fidelity-like protein [Arabidopsis thaliana]|eukprot:NP_200035.4 chromosome transmission fidelity-like protein [Arabidopsis thaliana]
MEIRVKCRCGEEECSEWAIVELQGVVETQASFQGSIQNLEIGRLCHSDSSQGTYTFTVGYHELVGSKVTLKKPLLVLKKLQFDEVSGKATELEVVGIIRTKILFKTRPKPLISGNNNLSLNKLKPLYCFIISACFNNVVSVCTIE